MHGYAVYFRGTMAGPANMAPGRRNERRKIGDRIVFRYRSVAILGGALELQETTFKFCDALIYFPHDLI
jgi:hypothetical protein